MNWTKKDSNSWTKEKPLTAYLPWQELKDAGWTIEMKISYIETLYSFAALAVLVDIRHVTEEILFYFYAPSLKDARTRAESELNEVMAYRRSVEWVPSSTELASEPPHTTDIPRDTAKSTHLEEEVM